MNSEHKLKEISKKNIKYGIFNTIFLFPFFLWFMTHILYYSDEKKKPIELYALDFFLNPYIFSIFFLIVANLIVDFLSYKNLKWSRLKKLLFLANTTCMLFLLDLYFDRDIFNIYVFYFCLGFLLFIFYKIYKYYQYYKLAKELNKL